MLYPSPQENLESYTVYASYIIHYIFSWFKTCFKKVNYLPNFVWNESQCWNTSLNIYCKLFFLEGLVEKPGIKTINWLKWDFWVSFVPRLEAQTWPFSAYCELISGTEKNTFLFCVLGYLYSSLRKYRPTNYQEILGLKRKPKISRLWVKIMVQNKYWCDIQTWILDMKT